MSGPFENAYQAARRGFGGSGARQRTPCTWPGERRRTGGFVSIVAMSEAIRLEELLLNFTRTPWGALGAAPDTAAGMCTRASVALLATLDRQGVDWSLWNMANLKASEWGGPGDGQHFVVAVGSEALDMTARQFVATNPYPLREPLEQAHERWEAKNLVDPDDVWQRRWIHHITPRWRALPDVAPPGDELGWPSISSPL
jgi:hypothetical protein